MEANSYTPADIERVIGVLENYSVHKDYNIIDEILPLAIQMLKTKVQEPQTQSEPNFCAPVWVDVLLSRLIKKDNPLTTAEYNFYRAEVSKLSVNDYKPIGEGFSGYKVAYLTEKDVSRTVLALKQYFKCL